MYSYSEQNKKKNFGMLKVTLTLDCQNLFFFLLRYLKDCLFSGGILSNFMFTPQILFCTREIVGEMHSVQRKNLLIYHGKILRFSSMSTQSPKSHKVSKYRSIVTVVLWRPFAQMSVEVVKCIVSVLLNCFNQFDRDIKY